MKFPEGYQTASDMRKSAERISARIKVRQEEINRYYKMLDQDDLPYNRNEVLDVITMLEGFTRDDEDRLSELHAQPEL